MRYFQSKSVVSILYCTDDDMMVGEAPTSGHQIALSDTDRRDLRSNRFIELTREEFTEFVFMELI